MTYLMRRAGREALYFVLAYHSGDDYSATVW